MLISLLLTGIAFLWLGYETKWLTIRLPYGASQSAIKMLPAPKPALMITGVKPLLLLDTVHDKPTSFVALDMPELSGELNIVCRME